MKFAGRTLISIGILLLASGQSLFAAERPRVAVMVFDGATRDAAVERFAGRVSETLLRSIIALGDFEVVSSSDVETVRRDLLPGYRDMQNGLMRALGRRLKADIVIGGSVAQDGQNGLVAEARILDVGKSVFLSPIRIENRIELQDLLLGDLVNRVAAEMRVRFVTGGPNNLTETSIPIQRGGSSSSAATSSSSAASSSASSSAITTAGTNAQQVPAGERIVSLNAIFSFGKVLPLFGNEADMRWGIDFVFDIERSYFSFGFGTALVGTTAVDIGLFAETHFFENDFYRNWQVYLRTGPALSYPLKSTESMAFKLNTAVGIRLLFPYFMFDAGFGIDYYSTQKSSLYLKIGTGFHF